MDTHTNVEHFTSLLLAMDRLGAEKMLSAAGKKGQSIELLEQIIVPSLEQIGSGWNQGKIALSQVYMSGRICEQLVDTFLPPSSPERTDQPTMAIALLEDYHSLGKTIVYSALRASGYELHDYGRVSVAELVRRAQQDSIRILLISTLMLRSALLVKQVKEQLVHNSPSVKIVVGGAPFRFDTQLWTDVGADAMGATAADAIKIIRGMTEELA